MLEVGTYTNYIYFCLENILFYNFHLIIVLALSANVLLTIYYVHLFSSIIR